MLLPSPRTSDTNGAGHHGDGGMDLRTAIAEIPLLPTPAAKEPGGTPEQYRARLREHDGREGSFLPLSMAVQLLPTPTSRDSHNAGDPEKTDARMAERGQPLSEVVVNALRLLPTPTVKDAQQSGGSTPADVTLTDAVVRTRLGEQENPRHAQAPETGSREELRGMRDSAEEEAIQEWPTGGSERFPEAQTLLPELCEQSRGRPGEHAPMESASDQAPDSVRGLWNDEPRAARSPHRPGCHEQRAGQPDGPVCVVPSPPSLAGGSRRSHGVDFGSYEAAIQRWESVLGREAPAPTKLNAKGNAKLSDAFDEFLMGFPKGWITDVPGVTWNETLKACGNGVVWQQGAAAIRWLLRMARWAA